MTQYISLIEQIINLKNLVVDKHLSADVIVEYDNS